MRSKVSKDVLDSKGFKARKVVKVVKLGPGPLGTLVALGFSEVLLAVSWAFLGAVLDPPKTASVLGPPKAVLRTLGAVLGPPQAILGPLGRSWAALSLPFSPSSLVTN